MRIQGNAPAEIVDPIMTKPALPIPITMACAIFTSTKVDLHSATIPERDVLQDAYFISTIWRLFGKKIIEKRLRVDTQLLLVNAVYVGAGRPREPVLGA